MAGTTVRFAVPGRPFAASLAQLKDDLLATSSACKPFPLARLFDFIKLTQSNTRLEQSIRARGQFEAAREGVYRNRGRIINEVMQDIGPDVPYVRLYIPPAVELRYELADAQSFTLQLIATRILLTFPQPPAPGFGDRFVVDRLVVSADRWTYVATEEFGADRRIEIVVDLGLDPPLPRPTSSAFAGFDRRDAVLRPKAVSSRALRLSGDCLCCGGFQPVKPSVPPGPRVVTLHAKIIWPNPNFSVQEMIDATNQVYAAADLTVRLGSVEQVNLPDFFDVDIGRCVSFETSDEQRRLFTTVRAGVGPSDVCAYWVRSVGLPVIGCAAHPRGLPSLICSQFGTHWLLAHELGHVLGLSHVDESDSDNIMRPVDAFTNPPPDLNAGQIATMRASCWTHAAQLLARSTADGTVS